MSQLTPRLLVAGMTSLFMWLAPSLSATIQLPAIMGDHMVLQQSAFPALWGRGQPGEQVVVVPSWDTEAPTVAYADSKGRWRVPLLTPTAGGPYEILVQGVENRIILRDVWIGEVWLVGGGGAITEGSASTDQALSPFDFSPKVRLFQVASDHASTPRADLSGAWGTLNDQGRLDRANPLCARLAQRLYDSLQVPIGIIQVTQPGVPLATWARREVFEADPKVAPPLLAFQAAQRAYRAEPDRPNPAQSAWQATTSYNAMLAPLIPFELAGMFWGQDPVDAAHPYRFRYLLTDMVQDWQQQWGYRFPFYLVQAPAAPAAPKLWGLQLAGQAIFNVRGAGVVAGSQPVATPQQLAGRMADLALKGHYQRETAPLPSAVLDQVEQRGDSLLLRFRPENTQIVLPPLEDLPLRVLNEKGRWVAAQMQARANTLLIYAPGHQAQAVRYGEKATATGSYLANQDGVPLLPFRTDTLATFWHQPPILIRYERGTAQFSLISAPDPALPYQIHYTSAGNSLTPETPVLPTNLGLSGPDTLVLQAFRGAGASPWRQEIPLLRHPGQQGRILYQRGKRATVLQGADYYGLVDGIQAQQIRYWNEFADSLILDLEWDDKQTLGGASLALTLDPSLPREAEELLGEGIAAGPVFRMQVYGSKNGRKEKLLGEWSQAISPEQANILQQSWSPDDYKQIRLEIRPVAGSATFWVDEWELK